MSEEDVGKVRGLLLCENHSRHPERINSPTTPSPPAKKHKTNTPTSPLSPDTAESPTALAQTEGGGPEKEGKNKTKSCSGINNLELETFMKYKYGFSVLDDKGYPWGEIHPDWSTYKSRFCTGEARRTKGAERCEHCHQLNQAMQNARSRHRKSEKEGTQHFIPTSALKVSPFVRDMIEKFRKENTAHKQHEREKEDENDLEIEVSDSLLFSWNTPSNVFFCCCCQSPEDNDYLVEVCLRTIEALEKSPAKETFFIAFLKQQLLCATKESGRAFRWNKEIVNWALTLQFHGGGRIINDLRGKANSGMGQHGNLNLDLKNWGIFLPGNSTLRNYLPPVEVYEGFKKENIENFKKSFPKDSPRKVLIAWDEIEIRFGLIWNPSTKELIGRVDGSIVEKEAKSANWAKMNDELATHVMQFFLVSADGAASLPIGFHPMTAINGEKVFKIVEPLLKQLGEGEDALEVVATASDAFPSNAALISLLKTNGFTIAHIFDPLHLLKSMRNNLWNQILSKDGTEFNLNTLDDLMRPTAEATTRRLFNSLHPGSPFPKDQMDLAPIRKLLSNELIEKLKERPEPHVQKLGEYLENMRTFDQATVDNEANNDERFLKLSGVVNYFKGLKGLTSGLVEQLSTTVSSIKKVYDLSQKEGEGFDFRVSVLGTIVVENFFSTVRAKCRYPNLWESKKRPGPVEEVRQPAGNRFLGQQYQVAEQKGEAEAGRREAENQSRWTRRPRVLSGEGKGVQVQEEAHDRERDQVKRLSLPRQDQTRPQGSLPCPPMPKKFHVPGGSGQSFVQKPLRTICTFGRRAAGGPRSL